MTNREHKETPLISVRSNWFSRVSQLFDIHDCPGGSKLAAFLFANMAFTEWELLRPASRRAIRVRAAKEKGRHTKQEWLALKAFFKFRCVKCGWREKPFEQCTGSKFVMEKDHVVSIMLGGCDCIVNLQPLCNSCNAQKGGRDSTDYRWKRIQDWKLNG